MRAIVLAILFSALTLGPYVCPVVLSAPNPNATALGRWAPAEVTIAQYGAFEDSASFTSAGFQAVRFDPPYAPPFRIKKISFPSLTRNGVPAIFPSVRLAEFDPASRTLIWDSPLLHIAPYVGNADGMNEIATDIAVSDSGKVFFFCVEFPSASTLPDDYPFLRADLRDMERGSFFTSYTVTALHRPGPIADRNIVVSISFELSPGSTQPPSAPTGLAMNLKGSGAEFTYDLLEREMHSIARVELFQQVAVNRWVFVAASQPGSLETISLPTLFPGTLSAVQAVDEKGQRSVLSNVVRSEANGFDEFEPNGSIEDAVTVASNVPGTATIHSAGDQDFYAVWAHPGDLIEAYATGLWFTDGIRDLDLVGYLYDERGRLLASDNNSGGGLNPSLTYRVRPASRRVNDEPKRFTIRFADRRGTNFAPELVPIYLTPFEGTYSFRVIVTGASSRVNPTPDLEVRGFQRTPGGVVFAYTIPHEMRSETATIRIFDVRGRLVRTLTDGAGEGIRTAVWDRNDANAIAVGTGIYFARVEVAGFQRTVKIVVAK